MIREGDRAMTIGEIATLSALTAVVMVGLWLAFSAEKRKIIKTRASRPRRGEAAGEDIPSTWCGMVGGGTPGPLVAKRNQPTQRCAYCQGRFVVRLVCRGGPFD